MGRGRKAGAPPVWATRQYIYDKYVTDNMSFAQIAKLHGTFPNTVRRLAKRFGIDSRSKSDAQKNYLDINGHPMEGRERTEEEKLKISEGIQEHWDTLDPDEAKEKREQLGERARQKWENMSDVDKGKSITKMHKANREKAGQGSKNENMVAQMLEERGYKVYQRTTEYTPGQKYEIDIAIPSKSIAIEWDGAAHFNPIYGEDQLAKTQAKDREKDRALTGWGWTLIRFRDHSTAHSLAYCRRAIDLIEAQITTAKSSQVYVIDEV